LDGLFGNIPSNSTGWTGDKIAFGRFKNACAIAEQVEANLKKRGATRQYVPLTIGLPIIEKASIEDDQSLQEKWTNLLTNAADASFGNIRRNFSSILSDLEPVDAALMDFVIKLYLRSQSPLFLQGGISQAMKLEPAVCENSIRNLLRLGLLKPGVVQVKGISAGGHTASSYMDTDAVSVTQLGVDFYHAVNLSET
jgi:Abortive infection alpha